MSRAELVAPLQGLWPHGPCPGRTLQEGLCCFLCFPEPWASCPPALNILQFSPWKALQHFHVEGKQQLEFPGNSWIDVTGTARRGWASSLCWERCWPEGLQCWQPGARTGAPCWCCTASGMAWGCSGM